MNTQRKSNERLNPPNHQSTSSTQLLSALANSARLNKSGSARPAQQPTRANRTVAIALATTVIKPPSSFVSGRRLASCSMHHFWHLAETVLARHNCLPSPSRSFLKTESHGGQAPECMDLCCRDPNPGFAVWVPTSFLVLADLISSCHTLRI